MRKLVFIVFAIVTVLFAGCSDEYDDSNIKKELDNLKDRVSNLEKLCESFNTDIVNLRTVVTALQNSDYITGYNEMADGSGVIINFAKGGTIIINHGKDGKNGSDGQNGTDGENAPIIGIELYEKVYYWTITIDGKKEWLLDNKDNKIRVTGENGKDGTDGKDGVDGTNGQDGKDGENGKDGTDGTNGQDGQNGKDGENGKDGVTPIIGIDLEGYWTVDIGDSRGTTRIKDSNGNEVQAIAKDGIDGKDGEQGEKGEKGEKGDSMFMEITDEGDNVHFILVDGTEFIIPKKSQFDISFDEFKEIGITAGGTHIVTFTITETTDNVIVKVIAQNGWKASAKMDSRSQGHITVTAPDPLVEDEIIVLVNDGNDKTLMRNIDFITGTIQFVSSVYENLPASGGSYEVELSTNLNYTVSIPQEAQSWLSLAETRAYRKDFLTFIVTENEDNERSAIVTLRDDSDKVLESIFFSQVDGRGDTYVGDLILESEADLEKVRNAEFSKVIGNVTVSGNSLTSLQQLNNYIEVITGNFTISCSTLTSLDGLYGLKEIGGNFKLTSADIISFEGMNEIKKIGGDFSITVNSSMTSFASFKGLEKIESIGGDFNMDATNSLNSLLTFEGLKNLTSIGQDFNIISTSNTSRCFNSLTSFEGLDKLVSIGRDFKIIATTNSSSNSRNYYYSLYSLESFKGLEELKFIGRDFIINSTTNATLGNLTGCYTMHNFSSFNGLSKVEKIGRNFNITVSATGHNSYSLDNLSSFDGLNNLKSINGDFSITTSTYTSSGYTYSALSNLSSFNGLEELTFIGGKFNIKTSGYSNSFENFSSFKGLNKLEKIEGDFTIIADSSLDSFYSFEGLNNLNSIGGNFSIISTSSMNSLTSFEGLNPQYINGGKLHIEKLTALTDISTLNSIRSVLSDFQILKCPNLYNFCPLQYIVEDMGNGYFYVNACGNNPTKQNMLNGQCSNN